MPGWTEATVNELTDLYDADIQRLQDIPGVTFIMP